MAVDPSRSTAETDPHHSPSVSIDRNSVYADASDHVIMIAAGSDVENVPKTWRAYHVAPRTYASILLRNPRVHYHIITLTPYSVAVDDDALGRPALELVTAAVVIPDGDIAAIGTKEVASHEHTSVGSRAVVALARIPTADGHIVHCDASVEQRADDLERRAE